MNIRKLLDEQKELDKEILKRAGIKEYPFRNIKLALLVELGELANEWQGFKHWKKNKVINREKLVEEWSDCLHFALSLENELKQFNEEKIQHFNNEFSKLVKQADILGLENNINSAFIQTFDDVIQEDCPLDGGICLGISLGISLDEMEQAYLNKNKVNHKRQSEGY